MDYQIIFSVRSSDRDARPLSTFAGLDDLLAHVLRLAGEFDEPLAHVDLRLAPLSDDEDADELPAWFLDYQKARWIGCEDDDDDR